VFIMARAKKTTTTNNDSTSSKQVITMPEAGSIPAARKTAAPLSNPTPIDLDDQIRRRAYQLYEERGRVSGFEHEDWLQAEREIRGSLSRSQSA
jgi:hypothetical protein